MKAEHLSRYRDIARLLIRYGRSDLVRQAGIEDVPEERDQAKDTPLADLSERFANDLEALGPTYIKIGQLLSTRADLLPKPFLDALARLQTTWPPSLTSSSSRSSPPSWACGSPRPSPPSSANRWPRPPSARCTEPPCAMGGRWP